MDGKKNRMINNMMRYVRIFPILCVALLLGCAHSVKDPASDSASKYAPVNNEASGIVKYQAGTLLTKDAYREAALKLMYEKCNGKYEIIDETVSGRGWRAQDQDIFIKYKCVK